MFSSSVIISFFLKLYAFIDESAVVKAVKSVFGYIGRAFSGSIFGRIARFLIKAEESRAGSVSYKVIGKIKDIGLVPFRFLHRLSETSVIMRWAGSSFVLKTENILAMFVFAVFLIPHNMWNNAYGLIITVALSVLYCVDVVRKRGFRENVNGIWFSFILFVIAVATSVLISAYISDSIRVFMFFLTAFLLCLIVYGTLTSMERLGNLSMAIYWAVFITGILALIQKRLGIAVDPTLTDVKLNQSMPGRAFATLGNPNNYAEFLLVFIPFAFAFAMNCRYKEKKFMLVCGMAVPFVALLLTYSRSGWLGFAASIVVFVFFYNWKLLPILIVIGLCLVPFMPHSIMERIMTIGNLRDSSSAYRLDIWLGTFYMLKYFWFRGTGLGPIAFKEVYPLYAVITARSAPHSHMLLLEVWAEMGILGLLCFIYLICGLVRRSCKKAIVTKNNKLNIYYIAAVSSMAGIFTMGLFEYVWFYPRVLYAFFIAVGIVMATLKLSKDDNI